MSSRSLHQRRIGDAHLLDRRVHQRRRQRSLRTGAPRGEDRATDDPTQYVATTFVGGQHAVGDEHRHGATVLGDSPNRDVGRFVVAVARVDRA